MWYYGKTTCVLDPQTGKKKQVKRPKSEWLAVSVPAIVEREIWEQVQRIREQNKRDAKRNRKYKYLLAGHIRCGQCGLSVSGKSSRTKGRVYLKYICNGHQRDTAKDCDLPGFRVGQVDAAVWDWIKVKMSSADELRREIENRQAEREAELAPLRERLTVIDDLLVDNRAQLERLLDLYLSGNFPKEMLTERKARLETTIEALDKERRTLAATLQKRALTNEDVQSIEDLARNVQRAFAAIDDDDFGAKRAMVERLHVQVSLVVENGLMIAYLSSPILGKGVCRLTSQFQYRFCVQLSISKPAISACTLSSCSS